jgi:hypothetical protein
MKKIVKSKPFQDAPTHRQTARKHTTQMIIQKILQAWQETRDDFIFIRIPRENTQDEEIKKKIKPQTLFPIIFQTSSKCKKRFFKSKNKISIRGRGNVFKKLFTSNQGKDIFSIIENNNLDLEHEDDKEEPQNNDEDEEEEEDEEDENRD